VADRVSMPLYVVPSAGDGITRVFVIRPGPSQPDRDSQRVSKLYLVAADDARSPPVERLVAPDLLGDCGIGGVGCFAVDGQGRLLASTGDPTRGGDFHLNRIDPLTGDETDLGVNNAYTLSPSRRRILVQSISPGSFAIGPSGPGTLYEDDGTATPIDSGPTRAFFIDEVLYYVDTQQRLVRVPPGGPPEVIATAVLYAYQGAGFAQSMRIERGSDTGPANNTSSLLNLVTLKEWPCPEMRMCALSPDGQWLATAKDTITFTNVLTGAQEQFAPPGFDAASANGSEYPQWRPGHAELWVEVTTFSPETSTAVSSIWVKKPGADPLELAGAAFALQVLSGSAFDGSEGLYSYYGPFSADGAYWFSSTNLPNHKSGFQVGLADAPSGPRVTLAPPIAQSNVTYVLADGQVLTPAWTTTFDRADLYVVDPTTGDARVMGEDGALLEIGRTRLLVNQHHIESAGDLTVFDLATGRGTVIAREFSVTATVEKSGADALAPGAQIAYQFTARFPSPYDGIWVASAP
jgi:hypothetical protein